MPNRVFRDLRELRPTVVRLIEQGRFRISFHARLDHPELNEMDKLEVVRYGGRDRPDSKRPAADGVYVCWARHPVHGLCRGVYAVEQVSNGDLVVVITAFKE
jgi:hypothetical protein